MIPVGKVIRPHGLKGLLQIASYSGAEASFTDVKTVYLRPVCGEIRQFTVISIHPHKNIFLMDVAELGSADKAEAYRGAVILLEKKALAREPDTYFWHELLGLRVYADTGEFLGLISNITPTGANDIYVVQKGDKEIYIPATVEVVKQIDLEQGKMIVSPMEGLLNLNEI